LRSSLFRVEESQIGFLSSKPASGHLFGYLAFLSALISLYSRESLERG
jgi:hypothetical protein